MDNHIQVDAFQISIRAKAYPNPRTCFLQQDSMVPEEAVVIIGVMSDDLRLTDVESSHRRSSEGVTGPLEPRVTACGEVGGEEAER